MLCFSSVTRDPVRELTASDAGCQKSNGIDTRVLNEFSGVHYGFIKVGKMQNGYKHTAVSAVG